MGTGTQVVTSVINSQGTDAVLGVFTDKVWLIIIVLVLLYALGRAHGKLTAHPAQQQSTKTY